MFVCVDVCVGVCTCNLRILPQVEIDLEEKTEMELTGQLILFIGAQG